jgi:hypothetical protein
MSSGIAEFHIPTQKHGSAFPLPSFLLAAVFWIGKTGGTPVPFSWYVQEPDSGSRPIGFRVLAVLEFGRSI